MPASIAAGLLMYKQKIADYQFFLVHPGGPFYQKHESGVWSIPKGIPETGEELLVAAQREFEEETGLKPAPPFYSLGHIRQKGGKVVHAWAFEGDWDPSNGIRCNTFTLEWPPRSGKIQSFPEVDRAGWFTYEDALPLLKPEQVYFLNQFLKERG